MVEIYAGPELGAYGFPDGHPFSLNRQDAFLGHFYKNSDINYLKICKPVIADETSLELFHTTEYIRFVKKLSETGFGYLDGGDTPAFPGVYEAAAFVAGSAVNAAERIMKNEVRKVFIPIGGLHHARRDSASGFCVFNDPGIVIEFLLKNYNLNSVAYIDIDAHHGDGVYYEFEDNPSVIFSDIHESGRFLFPGTGFAHENGINAGKGYKLNIEMNMGSNDIDFNLAFSKVMEFLSTFNPEFVIMQCGADSLAGDPLTHLAYSENAHTDAAYQIATYANEKCGGKMLAIGGGGYNLSNIGKAWCGVVSSMLRADKEYELSNTSI